MARTTKRPKTTLDKAILESVAVEYYRKGDYLKIRKPGDWDYCPICQKLAARSGIRNHYRVKHPKHFIAVELHIAELRERNGRN